MPGRQRFATGSPALIIRLIAAGEAEYTEASLRPHLEAAFPDWDWDRAKWDYRTLIMACNNFLQTKNHGLEPSLVATFRRVRRRGGMNKAQASKAASRANGTYVDVRTKHGPQIWASGSPGLIIRLMAAEEADATEASLRPHLEAAYPDWDWDLPKWDRVTIKSACSNFLKKANHGLEPQVIAAFHAVRERSRLAAGLATLAAANDSENKRIKTDWCSAEFARLKNERIRSGETVSDRVSLTRQVADNWLHSEAALEMHGPAGVKHRLDSASRRRKGHKSDNVKRKQAKRNRAAEKAAAVEVEVASMSDF